MNCQPQLVIAGFLPLAVSQAWWFKSWPFYPLFGGHDSPLKGSLNHPKKGTNCQQGEVHKPPPHTTKQNKQQIEGTPVRGKLQIRRPYEVPRFLAREVYGCGGFWSFPIWPELWDAKKNGENMVSWSVFFSKNIIAKNEFIRLKKIKPPLPPSFWLSGCRWIFKGWKNWCDPCNFPLSKFILFSFCWYFGVCVQIWQSLKRDLGEEQGGAVPVIMSRGPITPLMRVK